MNVDKIPYSEFEEYKEDNISVDIREKLNEYLYHWPLFLLAISLCLGLAFIHLRFSSPIYAVKAKLLIKDGASLESTLSERDLFKGRKLIENEIEILKSRTLMKQVVSDLQLWVNYEVVNDFRTLDIYGSTPLIFSLLKSGESLSGQVAELTIVDDTTFILKQPHSEQSFTFDTRLKSRFGTWELQTTGHLANYYGKTIRITLNNPENVTYHYQGAINAVLSRDQSTVVDLSIRDFVPERAEDILNRLIVVYNSAAIADRNKVSESSLRFIEDRLSAITGELTAVEKDVEGYKSSRGLTDISSKSQIFLDNVKGNDAKINEVKLQFQVIKEIERYIYSNDNTGMAPSTLGISDPILLGLIDRLMTLESQRDRLLATIPEGNPIFQPINRQISSTKSSISENIKGIKSTLMVTQGQLDNFNDSFKASIREIPGQEREYISIKRQQSIKEDLYIYLLQKREEAAVNYASTISGSRIVDSAYFVGQQTANKPYTYALAFILGLILPAGLIFSRQLINNRIVSKKEIQSSLAVPILGELCYENFKAPIVIENVPGRILGEQFRALRTNLSYVHGKKKHGKVTLLTSGMPGEGKSFITINLAAALANAERKTVILELDFRKPSILTHFNIKQTKGMSNYLIGQATKEEIVQVTDVNPNLFVVGTGPLPPNPSELLELPETEELIDWLRLNFDEILIDTPPILLVTDAMILSRYSDVNLFVIRYGFTYKSQLEMVNQLHKEHKLQKLNIVFNGVESRINGYNYSYYNNEDKQGVAQLMRNVWKRF